MRFLLLLDPLTAFTGQQWELISRINQCQDLTSVTMLGHRCFVNCIRCAEEVRVDGGLKWNRHHSALTVTLELSSNVPQSLNRINRPAGVACKIFLDVGWPWGFSQPKITSRPSSTCFHPLRASQECERQENKSFDLHESGNGMDFC